MQLFNGDSLIELKQLEDNSVDSVVTDPPYGLSIFNNKWDYNVPEIELWKSVYRVLKPGGHLLSFAGSRTFHRMAVNIEDAGFEIRDMINWIYSNGMAKSMNIGLVYDKQQGNTRNIVGTKNKSNNQLRNSGFKSGIVNITNGSSEFEGLGTQLKPSHEPIVLARKPLSERTIIENIKKWNVGGLNINKSRVPFNNINKEEGRFPANTIHDGSQDVLELFPESNGAGGSTPNTKVTGYGNLGNGKNEYFGGERKSFNSGKGSAARFFYCAKPSKMERQIGTDINNHPTIKPIRLMLYLIKLITPNEGIVLDPFMGSGTTGMASIIGGFNFIGVEKELNFFNIAKDRIDFSKKNRHLFLDEFNEYTIPTLSKKDKHSHNNNKYF